MYKYKKFTLSKQFASETLSAHHYFGKPTIIPMKMICSSVIICLTIHISIVFAIPQIFNGHSPEEIFFKIGCNGVFNKEAVQYFYEICVSCSVAFHDDFLRLCSEECFISDHYIFDCIQYNQQHINRTLVKCALNELQGTDSCPYEQKLFN